MFLRYVQEKLEKGKMRTLRTCTPADGGGSSSLASRPVIVHTVASELNQRGRKPGGRKQRGTETDLTNSVTRERKLNPHSNNDDGRQAGGSSCHSVTQWFGLKTFEWEQTLRLLMIHNTDSVTFLHMMH